VQVSYTTGMRLRVSIVVLVALTGHWLAVSAQSPKADAFEFLRPTIQFSADDRRQLDERGVVLRILPASGQELATMVAASLNVGTDAFIAKVRNIVALKKGPQVPQIDKFSLTPAIEDLRQLTLDDSDINTIERCRPNRCGLKLNTDEIERLHRASAAGASDPRERVQREFRQIVLERAKRFLADGTQETKSQFLTLMQRSPYILRTPQLANYLQHYPAVPLSGAESFLYWSKETYAWNPMISVTQVTILRSSGDGPLPEVLVISRDIFSTRYTGGSLVLSSLFRDPNAPAHQRYLVYVNRTWVDGIRALWRPLVEYRVKTQAKKVFAGVRDRLEQAGPLSTQ
jgi:hypothetical protein